jgi:hypothetical protein
LAIRKRREVLIGVRGSVRIQITIKFAGNEGGIGVLVLDDLQGNVDGAQKGVGKVRGESNSVVETWFYLGWRHAAKKVICSGLTHLLK